MRLIDADAFKMEDFRHCIDCDSIMQVIKYAQTIDAVPVVRCKDCARWGGVAFGNTCYRWSSSLGDMRNCTGPDDFCSYGKRKEKMDLPEPYNPNIPRDQWEDRARFE